MGNDFDRIEADLKELRTLVASLASRVVALESGRVIRDQLLGSYDVQ